MSCRILFAIHTPSDPLTAVYANVLQRAEALRARGHSVTIVGPETVPFGRWRRLAPVLLPIGLLSLPLHSYDVIVFHSHIGWAFHLRHVLGRRTRRPVTVTSFHGLEPLYFGALGAELRRVGTRLSRSFRLLHQGLVPALLKFTCRQSDAVFCLNTREREFIVQQRWAAPENVHVVQNGVQPSLLQPRTHRDRARTLLFVGQWLPMKGTADLVSAFSRLAADHADIVLLCAGTGAPADVVRRAFPATLRDRVNVRPQFERLELSGILSQADVFVFPSMSEGASGALLEAMASGLPIVATSVGAAPDMLVDGTSALLVRPGDPDALLHATARLLRDLELRRQLGAAAQEAARERTWPDVNANFVDLLLSARQGRVACLGR